MGSIRRGNGEIVSSLRSQVNTKLCDSKMSLKHSGKTYEVQVHGCVLSSGSAVVASAYEEWLLSPRRSHNKFSMDLKLPNAYRESVCSGAVDLLVGYFYGDAVQIPKETAAPLFTLAEAFEIQDLADACSCILSSQRVANASTSQTNRENCPESPDDELSSCAEVPENLFSKSENNSSGAARSSKMLKNQTKAHSSDSKINTGNLLSELCGNVSLSSSSGEYEITSNQSGIVENEQKNSSTIAAPVPEQQEKSAELIQVSSGYAKDGKNKHQLFTITKERLDKKIPDTVEIKALPSGPHQKFQYSDGSGGIRVELPFRLDNGKRSYFCNICGKVDPDITNLRNHVIRVHTRVRVLCPHCNRQFVNPKFMSFHIRRYHSKHPYKQFLCELCGYKTIHSYQMGIHNRRHHGADAFTCEHPGCDYKAYVKAKLKEHVLKHAGRREHLCCTCGSAFTTHYQLRRHARTHDRPYGCNLCDFRCARQFGLKNHVLKHHPENRSGSADAQSKLT